MVFSSKRMVFSSKSAKMDKKIVYTSERCVFSSKSFKMDHKKIVYPSWRWVFPIKIKNGPRKDSIHFWEIGFPSKGAKMD